MKISLKHFAAGIGLISLMTFLFFKTNVIDTDAHNQFSRDLRHLKELDATIDKDILESRYGLAGSYDLLMNEIEQINQLRANLKNIPSFVDKDEREQINILFDRYAASEQQKESLIEHFKSRNAIINNSLRYFPVTTSNLIKKITVSNSRPNTAQNLNNLLRDTVIYYLLTDTKLEAEITQQIALLKKSENESSISEMTTELEISIAHSQTILKLKPEVDELVKDIVEVPTAEQIEELIKLYDTDYNYSLRRANAYKLLLYIFSVLLLVYIAYIVVRLKKATTAVTVVNENLEQRVQERTESLVWSNLELQKSELNNRALLHAIPDSMWRTDHHGIFLDVIPAKNGEELGLQEKWLGQTVFEVLPTDVAEKIMRSAKISLETGEIQIFEYKLEQKDKIHHYESRIGVCGESEVLTIVRDISERKLLEERLQRAQKLESIGQLAAGIAHEINTPTQYVGDNTRFLKDSFEDLLTIIKANEQLLRVCDDNNFVHGVITDLKETIKNADTAYLTEEIPKSIEQALTGIERIGKIVQSMKEFAHPGSVDKKSADLNRAIESTITVASNEWRYVADLITDFDNNLPGVPCFIGELNQVILNMIVNAAHAISDVVGDGSGGKGIITITTKLRDEWAEISISDTGTGISKEICKKIFDPFFTTKEVGRGTGQGLAISHSVITEKHKGMIKVESEIGRGTTFLISLPLGENFT